MSSYSGQRCPPENPPRLNILSWNIHDASDIQGKKISDPSFLSIINKADIFCLQETKEELKIPNYKCFNANRSDSRSGGVCLGIRNDLSHYLCSLNTEKFSKDFQAVQLSKHILGSTRDLVIINVYDSPPNSSYKSRKVREGETDSTLSKVSEFCANLPPGSLIFMIGDMNARTGSKNSITGNEHHVLQQLVNNESFRNDSSLASCSRNSRDEIVNDRGDKLLDFGCEWNLTIINGSILGDVLGEWTCYRYNGNSVVDYIMASHELKESISNLQVMELSEHSDHRPLLCSLRTTNLLSDLRTTTETFEDSPLGYKWDTQLNESKKKFLTAQEQENITAKIADMCATSCDNEEAVYRLNDKLIEIFKDIANSSLECKRRPRGTKRANKKVWFDGECRNLKRLLGKVTRRYSKNPESEQARDAFHQTKKYYRSVLKFKKGCYFANLNRDIEESNAIKWSCLKKLKDAKKDPDQLDMHDLTNFYHFFKRLYSETPDNIQIPQELELNKKRDQGLADELLNQDITFEELNTAISKLKLGKAVGEDCIPNEFLRCSNIGVKLSIVHLFNQCLATGVYPWNVSLVTPLHKKGDRANPDNYRAIAVSSAIGKLFSNILLERLVRFRNTHCPDPPNQLGFCKEAQTADHIFTLSTCIDKYLGIKKRVYSCFIDFKKAFDSVNREALLYKLAILGVEGRFLECIKHMYSNSKAKIKLLGKLSKSLDVLVGTEQGHPMSPELFKIFLLDLSDELNSVSIDDTNIPTLNDVNITHLLWADDLVLLALDGPSLQKLIDIVYNYCNKWGLTVNISKTAILIFNSSGRLLQESTRFTYGSLEVPAEKKYCYLGITLALSGSLALTMDDLRKKGLRAYFSLKNLVDIRQLSVRAIFKLFDALILPVISYGCQIWFHKTAFVNQFISGNFASRPVECLSKISADPIERLHLRFLKWTLGVHKKASNIFCWGDTGRCPLLQTISKQTIDYFERLENMSSSCDYLVRHAFEEQRNLSLPWFKNMSGLIERCTSLNNGCEQGSSSRTIRNGALVKLQLETTFNEIWGRVANESSKLKFYCQAKEVPSFEAYLNIANRNV